VIKLIWIIIKVTALIGLAVWLADQPGRMTLQWHGYSIEATAAVLCVAILVLVAACLLAYRLVRLVRYGPRGMKLRRQLHNRHVGIQRLEQGFTALAAGDAALAGKQSLAARKMLGDGALTQWLQAQAAQLAGDHTAAGQIFTRLSKDKATAVLGYRGLIGAALKQQHHARAAALVEELAAVQPQAPWLHVARYEVATRQGAWAQAAAALRLAAAKHVLDVPDLPQREAGLMIAEARAALLQNQHPRAVQAAEQAHNRAPDWLPARIELVRVLAATGYQKLVIKRVEKFWATSPHPELAALYLQALGDGTPLQHFKRVEALCKTTLQHPASLLLLAQAAQRAELAGEANRHAARAATLAPTREIYVLLAELAEQEQRPAALVHGVLRQAAAAPQEPHWQCQSCGHTAARWDITCTACGSTHSVVWLDQAVTPSLSPMPTLLPLV
jgi:HemY protein